MVASPVLSSMLLGSLSTGEVRQDSKDKIVLRFRFNMTWKLEIYAGDGGTNWKTGNMSGKKNLCEVITSI